MELFISDLDGTLLDSNAEVSDFTRDTINRLTERGMLFTVATARSLASAGKILSGLELKVPIILMNGVLIYDMQKKEYIKINGLKRELSELVIGLARKFMLQPFMYSVSDNQLSTRYERLTSPAMEHFYKERRDKYYKSFTQVSDFSQHLDNVIYFTFIAKKERLAPLYEALKDNSELNITYYYDVYDHELWYLEVFSSAASKEHGVRFLREKFGFDRITAFGDNTNDIPMFRVADKSVAVKNACQEVLDCCDEVTGTNEENGVAEYLLKTFERN